MLDLVEFYSSDSDSDIEVGSKVKEEDCKDVDQGKCEEKRAVVSRKDVEKKKETLAMIRQFNTHILSLEKEKKSLLHGKKRHDGSVYNELEDLEFHHNGKRQKEKAEIKENLQKLSSKIEKFKREKDDVRKCASYIEKLKILMEDIEENIMQFKDRQRLVYEDLMSDENLLTTEIEASDKRIQLWQKEGSKLRMHTKESQKNNSGKQTLLPKEVEQFENFLQLTGGHQGGWDDIDHQTFLKLRKLHKKDEQLVDAAVCDIPTQSREDIEQHIEWYNEYCILRERKREMIQVWRNLKQNEKEDLLKNVDLDDTAESKKRKKREEIIEKERQERFEQLKKYKEQKYREEMEKLNREEEMKKEAKEKLKLNQMREDYMKIEQRLQVEEYRKKKKEEEDILRQAEEEQIRRRKQLISDEEKNRIKERNEKILETKRQLQRSKELERQQKEIRLKNLKQKVAVNVERDPNRLFKLTAGWERRKEDKSKNSTGPVASGARLMPHRSIPSWRRGLNT